MEFDLAPPGTIGLETALAVVLTYLVEPGVLPLTRAIEALATTPARILGAADHGGPLEPGRPANLVVFDPDGGVDGGGAVRLEGAQQRVPRRAAAREGALHDAARRVHRRGREAHAMSGR